MKFALVNGKKQKANISGERGKCICCGTETIAYCGDFLINHWKHKTLIDCDSWHEAETDWHREWKNKFPCGFQEVIQFDKTTGEKHIADIYNPYKGLTIEFQHSTITLDEINSRELFYKKMIWVIDLNPFVKNIRLFKDISESFETKIYMKYLNNWDRKRAKLENAKNYKEVDKMLDSIILDDEYVDVFLDKYESYVDKKDYYLLVWKHQHKRWRYSKSTIFFDIGDEFLYMNVELTKFPNGFVVKRFLKVSFIDKYNNEE